MTMTRILSRRVLLSICRKDQPFCMSLDIFVACIYYRAVATLKELHSLSIASQQATYSDIQALCAEWLS